MANLLGQPTTRSFKEGLKGALQDPGARLHWYGKAEAKVGRKMGHLNVVGGENLVERAKRARDRFYHGWSGASEN
jgi:phosphoribosylaminoimidazole carboxylase (NCAIR synthetase)